ncbi:uncharacterized protein [Narcine bancroftii]|uniref:uncharacterized protein n=1 Tax=Narcine bancroftii TaxID=1343680 RepID=UPI003831F08F
MRLMWTMQRALWAFLLMGCQISQQSSSDPCGAKVILKIDKDRDRTFQFDLCSVIACGRNEASWRGYDVYMCNFQRGYPKWGLNVCPSWGEVWWWTGPDTRWIRKPLNRGSSRPYYNFFTKISLIRGAVTHNMEGKNPLILTVKAGLNNPWDMKGWSSKTCEGGTGREHGVGDLLYLMIGVSVSGKDPWGVVRFDLQTYTKDIPKPTSTEGAVRKFDSTKLSRGEKIAIETGIDETNSWIDQMGKYADQAGYGNCWICARGRPLLRMSRSIFEETDAMDCALNLMSESNPLNRCLTWERAFPIAPANVAPPIFRSMGISNVTCFTNNNMAAHAFHMGWLPSGSCRTHVDLSGSSSATQLTQARADIWWFCGGRALYNWLPSNWNGQCALVTLNAPVLIVERQEGDEDALALHHTEGWMWRRRRSVGLFGPGGRNPDGVWIDAIGQARNIPNEFKLADEIAAGFESFPIFSAIFPITVNKNVKRINLIHYNVQRLANLTRDDVEAVHQQLSETSLMTLQNRIAIDMVLAEKGGVCAMFGDLCCTSISNNTGPDGSLTEGLTKLRALAKELKAQSGVSNPVLSWLQGVFGRWGTMLGQLFLGLFISVSIFITCGCCCIPCIRTLVTRTIERAFANHDELPPKYQAMQAAERDYLTSQEASKVAEIDLESDGECDGEEGL